MPKPMSIQEFMQLFPDDDACLKHLFDLRYGPNFACLNPKCGTVGKFHKLAKMPAYSCQDCGDHIHPMSGTFFYRSHTPLQKWFYAIYLFTTSRHGVPAKELQRQLSVSYETAWRMGHEIRKYIGRVDGDRPLSGHVEIDETLVGGRKKGSRPGRGATNRSVVLGMAERDGQVITRVVPDASIASLIPHITENVTPGSTVSTDEWVSYKRLKKLGYNHGTVNHADEEWARDEHHTNTLEGFWSLVKRAIKGTHVHVSRKYLANYLVEFEYRWNERASPETMFPKLLRGF